MKRKAIGELVGLLRGDETEAPEPRGDEVECVGCKQKVSPKFWDASFELCDGCVELLG
ncbi:MAG: hypothetical protein H0U12_07200 [Thermoleophilaceae bacterium]|nr:hypothetical protein [Thermoleophilaceae bacterium]